MKKSQLVFQFKVSLLDIEPEIWRRFQVRGNYSYWDLHVALQNVVGWSDSHLHAFRSPQLEENGLEIGIPTELFDNFVDDEFKVVAGWDVPLTEYFKEPGDRMTYEYDFGDGWEHEILLEGILLKEKGRKYPYCLAGEQACPPEDCGGRYGYYEMLEILYSPSHEEHEGMMDWLKSHYQSDYPYQADYFERKKVKFENPKKRWEECFLGSDNF